MEVFPFISETIIQTRQLKGLSNWLRSLVGDKFKEPRWFKWDPEQLSSLEKEVYKLKQGHGQGVGVINTLRANHKPDRNTFSVTPRGITTAKGAPLRKASLRRNSAILRAKKERSESFTERSSIRHQTQNDFVIRRTFVFEEPRLPEESKEDEELIQSKSDFKRGNECESESWRKITKTESTL